MDPTDPRFFATDADEMSSYYLERVAGTYQSNWQYLRLASAGAFHAALEAVGRVTEAWQGGLEKGLRTGEIEGLLRVNYLFRASGPLLSGVLLPSLAIESLSRLCLEVALRAREVQTVDVLALANNGFDVLSFPERIGIAVTLSGAPPVPKELDRTLAALIKYRNDLVHDRPYLYTATGHLLYARRGSYRPLNEDTSGEPVFPLVTADGLALSLSHARRAVAAHDHLVDHVISGAAEEFRSALVSLVPDAGGLGSIRNVLMGGAWEQSKTVVEVWEGEVLPWVEQVTEQDRESWFRDLMRKEIVRPVE